MADNVDLVRKMFAAIARGDEAAIRELCSTDIVLIEAGGTFAGIEEVVAHLLAMTSPFPDVAITPSRQVAADDVVASEMRFTGTQTQPMTTPEGTLPASGRKVDVPGCVLHTVRDGKITEHRGYYDQLLFMSQLGLLPQPVAG